MKTFSTILALLFATSAFASNKFSFVNARYIDEDTPWRTILRTHGYVVKSPVQYTAEGRQIDAMQTCRRGEKVFAWLTDAVWGSSQAGVVGVNWREVEIPSSYQRSICSQDRGSQAGCNPVFITVEQKVKMSFPVKVMAVQNYLSSSPREYWGVAFTKTFETPECR